MSDEKETRERAAASLKKQEQRDERAAAESEAEADAVREKTARLKSLRLARKLPEETTGDTAAADKAIPIDKLNASNDD